jgi:hypothetical protein
MVQMPELVILRFQGVRASKRVCESRSGDCAKDDPSGTAIRANQDLQVHRARRGICVLNLLRISKD